ncbi:hypothetical protein OG311_38500 (plasmid) [Streptomyces sp. NBC_01343]|uniref:hypothetical protein n=1 Tax=Streptomyces sp. NBC_01343 TaxID=2903832 RepID=UPI002E15556C|nr:hypothetical protein OG311_38500 [Streptomyces sp. NBC_01343]
MLRSSVLWRFNAAREAQTRLVVAEERPGFTRGLHHEIREVVDGYRSGTPRHGPSAGHTYRLTVHLPTGSSR